MGTVISFILVLQYGGMSKPWEASTVIGLLVGFVAIAATFGLWEYSQGERGAISRRLLSDRSVWPRSLYTIFFDLRTWSFPCYISRTTTHFSTEAHSSRILFRVPIMMSLL